MTAPATIEPFWTEADIISRYTREDGLAYGVLVDGQVGDFAEVSRQHFGDKPVAMTAAVFSLIKRAVENQKWLNDYKGVWHDVLSMMAFYVRANVNARGNTVVFKVIITGTGRTRNHWLKATVDAEGLLISLPNED